jgi:hypothetical protein
MNNGRSKLPLIGFTGRAGAGKDTACDMGIQLVEAAGGQAVKIAFADPLKYICKFVFGYAYDIPDSAWYGSQAEKNDLLPGVVQEWRNEEQRWTWTGREILQKIGTEGFMGIHPMVWARHLVKRAEEYVDEGVDVVFVNGVRFVQDAAVIKQHGGHIVRLRRPEADTGDNQGLKNHPSEVEQSSIKEDFVLDNKGASLDKLQSRVEKLLCDLHFLPLTSKQQGLTL